MELRFSLQPRPLLLLAQLLLLSLSPELASASQKYSVEPIGSGFFKEQQPQLRQQPVGGPDSREFVITSLAKNPRVRLDSGPFSATHYVQSNLHNQLSAINLTHVNFQPSVHFISSHLEPPEGSRSHTALYLLAHIDPTPEPARLNRNARVCFEVHVRAQADGKTEVGYCSIPVGRHECVVTVILKAGLAHQYTGSVSRVEATYNAYLSLQGANTRCYMSDHSAIRLHEEARSVPGSLPVVSAKQVEREIDNDLRVVYREQRLKQGNDLQVDVLVKEFSKIVTFNLEVQIEPPGAAAVFDHVLLSQRQNWITRWSIADGNRSLSVNGTISNEYYNAKLSTKSLICTVFVRALAGAADAAAFASDRVRLRWYVKKTSERGGNWVNRLADERAAIGTEHRLYDGVRGLVAVYKEADLLNLAAISGEFARSQLWLYAVNDALVPERIHTANCYHSKEEVIKVGKRCEYVYFNGTERSGGDGATITAKWRSHTAEFAFNVYYPVFPLRVTLTDSELQRIRGWRVPRLSLASGAGGGYAYLRSAPRQPSSSVLRRSRRFGRRAGRRRGGGGVHCRKKFQDARVQVFTRFIMRSQKAGGALLSIPKFSGGAAAPAASSVSSMFADTPAELPDQHQQLLDVTHFAVGRLTVSDSRVAALKGSTLEGVGRGRALVSVAEPRRGNASLSVGTGGSVRIDSVEAHFVTNLSVLLIGDQLMGRYLTAHISRNFERYNQSGYVRIVVRFTDGTEAAVEDIDPDYITVQVVSYNASALRPLDRSLRTNWPIFHAIAEAPDSALVTVRLLQSDFCGGGGSRGSGRPLLKPPASSLVEVRGRIKFPSRRDSPASPSSTSSGSSNSPQQPSPPQSPPTLRSGAGDVAAAGDGRQAPNLNLDSILASPSDYHQLFPGDASASAGSSGGTGYRSSRNGYGGQQPPDSGGKDDGLSFGGGSRSASSAGGVSGGKPRPTARRSPFQIGMFVLLAIFCLAVMVFFVNFAVMCARYRKHRRLPSADSSDAAHRQQQPAAEHQQQQFQHLLQQQSPLPLHGSSLQSMQSPSLLLQSGERRSPPSSVGAFQQQQRRGPLQPGEEEYTDNNWVWVGLDTLQDKKLCRDDGTIYRHTKFIQPVRSALTAAAAVPPTSSAASSGLAPQSPTDSTSHLTTFGRQGGPATATVASPGASVAAAAGTTYQGQECSIRIVANPLESLQPARLTPRLGTSSMLGSRQHSLATDGSLPRPPMRTSSRRLSPGAAAPPSSSMSPSPVPALNPCATPRFSRQLPPPYSASSSSSAAGIRTGDLSWSQSMRRMDYGQLLAYFDHMKETAA
ncbi:hypothetical protein BOX15_Mlig003491g1 [Macrostomum lignano]|uniref:TMEM132 domain-containing protein n=2 Tax=Macrostomum lignano TaxID=282301 RepID=A0A267G5Z4_9PLAT|nr:hypothetical protein BOX15_Mlig003491g1 [Macrostomum lignano]